MTEFNFTNNRHEIGFSFGTKSRRNPIFGMSLYWSGIDVAICIISSEKMGRAFMTGAESFVFQEAVENCTALTLRNDKTVLVMTPKGDDLIISVSDYGNPPAKKTFSKEDRLTLVEGMKRLFSETPTKMVEDIDLYGYNVSAEEVNVAHEYVARREYVNAIAHLREISTAATKRAFENMMETITNAIWAKTAE